MEKMMNTFFVRGWVFACIAAAGVAGAEQADVLRLEGPDSGLVLFEESHVSYVESDDGLEIQAKMGANKGAPLYLSLDVKDEGYINGASPILEFSFDYFDSGIEEITFVIDSSDPLYGNEATAGIWRGAGGLQFMDTQTWKTKTITFHDARFSNRLNGADIRFRTHRHPVLRLRNVSLKKLAAAPALPPSTLKQGESPNVLMIVFDDLNDYVGAFGNPNAKTPNLDSFAAGAMRFDRAYCQYPVCGPSRASFMTGMYPESSGVLDNSSHFRALRPDATNMLEYFKESGYWTASAGKIYHSSQNVAETQVSTYASDWFRNSENPLLQKLDRDFVEEVGPIDENKEAYQEYMKGRDLGGERVVAAVATDLADENHKDGRTATRISSYLEDKPFGDRPFFMACGFAKPHVPFYAPKKYFDMYPLEELEFDDVPEDDWANRPNVALYNKFKGYGVKFEENNRELRAKWLQAYLACISLADSQFGRVMQALEDSGCAENTIVVIFGDHGYHIGEHFLYGKVTLFEESARVPFMVRAPGKTTPGTQTQSFTELLDVYPTLTELCGLETPSHVEGKSFVSVLEDPDTAVRDSVYTVVRRTGMLGKAVRYKNWRYAEWGSADQAELYDLEKDPNEFNNLANNPEYKEVVQEMSELVVEKAP